MSSFIGQLRISLGLDSAAFESGAKRAAAEVNTLGTKAERAGFMVGSMTKALVAGAGALAGVAIVSQLKDAVSAGLDYATTLGRAAQISNASAAEFQKAAFAAKSVGIESEKLADIYKDVNDKVGEFVATGGGELKDFFTNVAPKVGVTADQFARLSGPEALQLYVSSLEKAGLSQQQMTFYMEALANDATALLPLLRNNGAAMSDLGDKAARLGIVMSDELVKKAGDAQKTLADLDSVMKAKLSITVAKNTDGVIAYANAYAYLTDKVLGALGVLGRMAEMAEKVKAGLKDGLFSSQSEANQTRDFLASWGLMTPDTRRKQPFPGAGAAIGFGLDTFNSFAKSPLISLPSSAAPGATRRPRSSGRLPGRAYGAANDDGLNRLREITRDLEDKVFRPFADRTAEQFARRDGIGAEDIAKRLSDISKVAGYTAEKTNAATVKIAKSFADMADDTVNALQNMSNSIRSGDFLSILGSAVKLVTQLGKIGVFGKATATRLNSIPGFANGTSFAPGGLALVGERGPEIVQLPRGAAVYRNGTGPGGGGFYFDLRGAVMTQDLLNQMNAIGAVSAQAGGEIGYNKVVRMSSRRLG